MSMPELLAGCVCVRRGGKGAGIALAVGCVSLPFWAGPYWTRVATGIVMWAGLALSWNVICGYAGYISFGHVAFFGIGAYSTAILMQPDYNWNFFATLPRSEERRVGKEGVRTCRYRGSPSY